MGWVRWCVLAAWLVGCGTSSPPGGDDASANDARPADPDAGIDGGVEPLDAGGDAGPDDAGPPDSGPVGPLECRRGCVSPARIEDATSHRVTPSGFNLMNVVVSRALRIGADSFYAYGADDCCDPPAEDETVSGAIRVGASDATTVITFGVEPTESIFRLGATFSRDGAPALIHPNGDWAEAAVLNATTLATESTLDLTGLALGTAPFATPSVAALTDGYVLLRGTQARLTRLDASLSPTGPPLDLGLEAQWVGLVQTCSAIVALFRQAGNLYSLALDADGVPAAATPTLVVTDGLAASLDVHAVWDGAAITVTGALAVYELDEAGALLTTTPMPRRVYAAVGTDEGLLVVEEGSTSTLPPQTTLRRRESGATIRGLGAASLVRGLGVDASIGVQDGRLDIVTSTLTMRSHVSVTRLSCM